MNGNRLSVALEESDDYQIFSDDVIQFGVEVTEASTEKETPNIHSGVYTLLKLYHPDGNLATRPIENEQLKTCPNISKRQLIILHNYLKVSINRENILKEKLAFLKTQLTNLEEITKKKWSEVIDEDLLLSKIETLQNRLESIINTNSQLKNLNDDDNKFAILTKEIKSLQEQKEIYQFEFKTIVKKTFDDKRIAEAKLQETELKLNSSLEEIKLLDGLVNKCKTELNSADTQITFLDDELKTYKLETKKLFDEKQFYENQIKRLKENELTLNELIKDLKLELEGKQLELKSINVFEDVINCSKNLNSIKKETDLEHIQTSNNQINNTHHNQECLNNGNLPNHEEEEEKQFGLNFKNCTDYLNCPILNEQSSQTFFKQLDDCKFFFFEKILNLINLIPLLYSNRKQVLMNLKINQ